MMKGLDNHQGFTLVELTMAMAVFSLMLLIVVAGVINIFHLYDGGLAMRDTQQDARSGLADIINEGHGAYQVSLASHTIPGTSITYQSICYFEPGQVVEFYLASTNNNASNVGLYKLILPSRTTTCPNPATNPSGQIITSAAVTILSLAATFGGPTTYTPGSPQILNINSFSVAPQTAIANNSVVGNSCRSGFVYCTVTTLQSSVSLQGNGP